MATAPRLGVLSGAAARQGLAEHLEMHGEPPALTYADGAQFIEEVAESGLRGRGGAAFPTATKMAAARAQRRCVVVANGTESEPLSLKDAWLLEMSPHLVLDGALLAAQAVGAGEVTVCVQSGSTDAALRVTEAIAEREAAQLLPVPVRLTTTPDAYLAGEETALMQFLNGGPLKPTTVPPRPIERGVDKRPTLVQNVETLAQLALIARHGSDWFRAAGTEREPGTALVTIVGAVNKPGVFEIEFGTPLRDLASAAGGTAEPVRAVLLGGYFGTWIGPELANDLMLHEEHLRPLGGGLGSGAIAMLPKGACGVAESARVIRYMAGQAAGQCGPCTFGLAAISSAMDEIVHGVASPTVGEDLARWAAIVPRRGACHHPDGAIRFTVSALKVFADEFAEHRKRGPCELCSAPAVLPTPVSPKQRRAR